ncbi:MAG: hypothetical protein AAB536_00505 [Patescibacteria group bacterium]|mgnify:CR=1 FL=1
MSIDLFERLSKAIKLAGAAYRIVGKAYTASGDLISTDADIALLSTSAAKEKFKESLEAIKSLEERAHCGEFGNTPIRPHRRQRKTGIADPEMRRRAVSGMTANLCSILGHLDELLQLSIVYTGNLEDEIKRLTTAEVGDGKKNKDKIITDLGDVRTRFRYCSQLSLKSTKFPTQNQRAGKNAA